MRARVAEDRVTVGGHDLRVRVDLHGVGVYGPGEQRTLIRWEWITDLSIEDSGVEVRSAKSHLTLPAGSYGLPPHELLGLLRRADSIVDRPDVIGELVGP